MLVPFRVLNEEVALSMALLVINLHVSNGDVMRLGLVCRSDARAMPTDLIAKLYHAATLPDRIGFVWILVVITSLVRTLHIPAHELLQRELSGNLLR